MRTFLSTKSLFTAKKFNIYYQSFNLGIQKWKEQNHVGSHQA
jgi:hypothetical protein